MRGCGCAIALVAPFWLGAYVVGGWEAVAWMALAGAVVELVLFWPDWLPRLRRRIART